MSRVLVRLAIGLLALYLLGFTYAASAQHIPYRMYIEHAEEAYDQKDYFNAFRFYGEALKFNHKDSLQNLERAAEAAFHSWRLDTAKHFLKRLIDRASDPCDSIKMKAYYQLGLTFQRVGNYKEAKDCLNEAVGLCPSSFYHKKMNDLMESLSWALQQKDSTGFFNVSDFLTDTTEHFLAPVHYDNHVLYTRQFFNSQKQADFIHQVGQIKLARSPRDALLRSDFDGAKRNMTIGFP
ncbi:MAG: tetratricopeptide repeat protein, partial [Saprospiraceae bacterium]|nr:tetratricopeptide repeat protein [Saprospiraceae bacterium]